MPHQQNLTFANRIAWLASQLPSGPASLLNWQATELKRAEVWALVQIEMKRQTELRLKRSLGGFGAGYAGKYFHSSRTPLALCTSRMTDLRCHARDLAQARRAREAQEAHDADLASAGSAAERLDLEVAWIAAKITRNEYGDLGSMPRGARFATGHGAHTRLPASLRATQVDGWRKGRPQKSTGYVVTDELLALLAAASQESATHARAMKKAAEMDASRAAGFSSIAAWKKAERERKAKEAAEKERLASIARAERKAKNLDRLKALGFEDREEYIPVLGLLELAARDGFEITGDHASAALYAREHNSGAWQAYCEGELSAGQLLHRCERAQHRHEHTNYEDLLRNGYDRDLARECAE